jgi:flagellar hook-associated protein 3 FlgL
MDSLSQKIANQSNILKPSDSPIGTSKILRLSSKISSTDLHINNIQNSFGFVNETIRSMESIEGEISSLLVTLTEANNAINSDNLASYADQLDKVLDNILTAANSSYDGKYLFGGTSFSTKPFSLTSDRSAVINNSDNLSGISKVNIGNGVNQKVNITGSELFGTIIKQSGAFDINAAIGDVQNVSTQISDAYGNKFDLNLSYEKITDDEYKLTYNIVDGGGTTVKTDSVNLKFDSYTGNVLSVEGKQQTGIEISSSAHKINFYLDFNSLKIDSTPSSLSLSANQEMNIFNTIIKVRDQLRNGLEPNAEDVNSIKDFHSRLLNKMSDAGSIYNTLENTKSLLESQRVEIESMLSSEKDLDMAKAIIDMQNYEYLLQVSYKMSAMILPKSLLDFI